MQTENLITENNTLAQELPAGDISLILPDKKKKKHNSALLAIAKARSEAIHRAGNSSADSNTIGTNITYKFGSGVL